MACTGAVQFVRMSNSDLVSLSPGLSHLLHGGEVKSALRASHLRQGIISRCSRVRGIWDRRKTSDKSLELSLRDLCSSDVQWICLMDLVELAFHLLHLMLKGGHDFTYDQ